MSTKKPIPSVESFPLTFTKEEWALALAAVREDEEKERKFHTDKNGNLVIVGVGSKPIL